MKTKMLLIVAILAVAAFLPGSAAGETTISFNESDGQVYKQMPAENASVGEYYERVCPGFLEEMPPEMRAHLSSTPMYGYHDLASDRIFVPPGKQVAIAVASPVLVVCGVLVPLSSIGLQALFGVVILALLAAVALVLKRVFKKK